MLSIERQELLGLLLKDPNISGCLLQEGEIARSVTVNDDGSITIGRTGRKWYNRLFNSERHIDFMTLALLISQKISGAKELDDNPVFAGLSREVLDKAFLNKKEDYIVDALWDTVRMVCDGIWKSNYSKLDSTPKQINSPQEILKKNYMPQHGSSSSRVIGRGKASIVMPSGDHLTDDICVTITEEYR